MKKYYIRLIKKLTLVTWLLCLVSSLVGFKFLEGTYTKKGLVTEVVKPCKAYKQGLVIFKDRNNREYSFEGSDDWLVNDLCLATMSDNGTLENLKDDYVVYDDDNAKVLYIGYINDRLSDILSLDVILN